MRHTTQMANEIDVTYGLIGSPPPSASRMPPTTDTTANSIDSSGTSSGCTVSRSAAAAGVPVRTLGLVFMLALGLATAVSVQIVGALLVLSLLVTPAAAALRVTVNPVLVPVLSVVFAVTSVVGGILLALGGGLPISPYVTTISFLIWVVCRVLGARRDRRGRDRVTAREQQVDRGTGLPAVPEQGVAA